MLIQPFSFGVSSTPVKKFLRLGQYYQGGYVITLGGSYPNQDGFIIAPVEISNSMSWPGGVGVSTPADVTDGFGNTQFAYNNGYTTNAIGTTWTYSVADTGTGIVYSDWFLPARDQLIAVMNNKVFIPYTLTNSTYHSSSSFGPNPANQNMYVDVSSNFNSGNKSDLRGVLAIRSITT
jgi:hypothetical protein